MDKNELRTQKLLIGIFSILLTVVLVIVAGVEAKKSTETKPVIEVTGVNKRISCKAQPQSDEKHQNTNYPV